MFDSTNYWLTVSYIYIIEFLFIFFLPFPSLILVSLSPTSFPYFDAFFCVWSTEFH